MKTVLLLLVFFFLSPSVSLAKIRVTFDRHKRAYSTEGLSKLRYGEADDFTFGRFAPPNAIEEAMNDCRSPKSFRKYKKGDTEGSYCSTRLGGDWVLAESKQIAKSCRAVDVLQAYLDGDNQKKCNPDKVKDCRIYRTGPGQYRQEMVLKPQRVLTGWTTVMRYTQKIRIDMIGQRAFNCFVQLDPTSKSTTKLKPFDKLAVNVSLREVGDDVHIYAAGFMRVNRKIVPNLYVFDASGIAGAMAGKGTLWLSSHFADRQKKKR